MYEVEVQCYPFSQIISQVYKPQVPFVQSAGKLSHELSAGIQVFEKVNQQYWGRGLPAYSIRGWGICITEASILQNRSAKRQISPQCMRGKAAISPWTSTQAAASTLQKAVGECRCCGQLCRTIAKLMMHNVAWSKCKKETICMFLYTHCWRLAKFVHVGKHL